VLRNRQRTSTRNGILKAEAARRFAGALAEHGIERLQNVAAAATSRQLEAAVRAIPDQRICSTRRSGNSSAALQFAVDSHRGSRIRPAAGWDMAHGLPSRAAEPARHPTVVVGQAASLVAAGQACSSS
jgi:hypothetical protein